MRTMLRPFLAVVLIAAATAGCVGSGSGVLPVSSRNPQLLTTLEIRSAVAASSAFDVVQALRPVWLRKRGPQSIHFDGEILVYYDHVRLGGVDVLRSIPVGGVNSIRFIDAASATQRWGTGHPHGVILVATNPGFGR